MLPSAAAPLRRRGERRWLLSLKEESSGGSSPRRGEQRRHLFLEEESDGGSYPSKRRAVVAPLP
jgi:hypothetical protein